MRVPQSLLSLTDLGIVQEVLRPLLSGKEADVYLVLVGGEARVAKCYKAAQDRTFKHRAAYTEGRNVRNTRDQRAMQKRTKHGRSQDESAWRSTEVDMIYRLQAAGVRVPTPYHFIDGVLIMELVKDATGQPAPRLGECSLDREQAIEIFDRLLIEVVRMLCAGVVHGDLSDFNVLLSDTGPVVIDFPQSVDASSNQNARHLLIRDVDNLQRFLARFAPDRRPRPYAQEMWDLYARNLLTPETRLGGGFRAPERKADTREVLGLIGDADRDERRRREATGQPPPRTGPPPRRVEVVMTPPNPRGRGGPPPAQGNPRGGSGPMQGNPRGGSGPGYNGPRASQPVHDARRGGPPGQGDRRGANVPNANGHRAPAPPPDMRRAPPGPDPMRRTEPQPPRAMTPPAGGDAGAAGPRRSRRRRRRPP